MKQSIVCPKCATPIRNVVLQTELDAAQKRIVELEYLWREENSAYKLAHEQWLSAQEARDQLAAAVREARCWLPIAIGVPESCGAQCETLHDVVQMMEAALQGVSLAPIRCDCKCLCKSLSRAVCPFHGEPMNRCPHNIPPAVDWRALGGEFARLIRNAVEAVEVGISEPHLYTALTGAFKAHLRAWEAAKEQDMTTTKRIPDCPECGLKMIRKGVVWECPNCGAKAGQ